MYLRESKIWCCEGEEGEEKVHLLTHATARGMGKKYYNTDPSTWWLETTIGKGL